MAREQKDSRQTNSDQMLRYLRDPEYQAYLDAGWQAAFQSQIDGTWDELSGWEDSMDRDDLAALETMVDTFAREFKARLAELKAERT